MLNITTVSCESLNSMSEYNCIIVWKYRCWIKDPRPVIRGIIVAHNDDHNAPTEGHENVTLEFSSSSDITLCNNSYVPKWWWT